MLRIQGALWDSATARAVAVTLMSDSLIRGRSVGAALAELATQVGAVADESGITLDNLVTLPSTDTSASIQKIAVRAQYTGDLEAVVDFFERVESSTVIMRMTSLVVQSTDVTATDAHGAQLRGDVVVEALAQIGDGRR